MFHGLRANTWRLDDPKSRPLHLVYPGDGHAAYMLSSSSAVGLSFPMQLRTLVLH